MATILIVDDRAVNRHFLTTLLGYGGHRLLEAPDGAQALELARAERPDLIITDVVMPALDGFGLVEALRRDPQTAGIPVVFYTATYRMREARALAEACGATAVLAKPSDPQTILATVQAALERLAPPAGASAAAAAPRQRVAEVAERFGRHLTELDDLNRKMKQVLARGLPTVAEGRALGDLSASLAETTAKFQTASLRLASLLELSLDLSARHEPGRLLEVVCGAAQDILGARRAALGILANDGKTLQHLVGRDLDPEVFGAVGAEAPRSGLIGRVLAEQRPVRLSGLPAEPAAAGLPAGHPPVTSYLGVPIVSSRLLYGWLHLADKRDGGEWSEEDEQLAATLAAQVAVAYENARLYEDLQRHAAQLQLEVGERRRAQEQVTASDRLLREAQRVANIGSWEWQIEEDVASWSEQLYAMCGIDPLTVKPDYPGYLEMLVPEDRPIFLAVMEDALVRPGFYEYQARIRRPDGTVRTLQHRFESVADESGRPQRMVGATMDITEREEARRALEERARLAALGADVGRALVEGGDLAVTLRRCAEAVVSHLGAAFARVWTLDESAQTLVLEASAGIYTHLDGPHSRVPMGAMKIGKIASSRTPHLTNAVANDPFVDREWARREGMVAFAGYPLIVGGRLVGVIALFARQALSDFALAALASVADEIALGIERWRTAAEVRARDERFRELAGSIREMFWMTSSDFKEVIYVSPAYAQIRGHDPAVLRDHPTDWLEAVLPEDSRRVRDFMRAVVVGEGQVEFRIRQTGGAVRWIGARGWPVRDAEGRIYRVAGIAEDVTERKSLEEQFRQVQRLEAVGRLAGGIAHDFNNLLTAINGYSELALRQVEEGSPVKSHLEEVQRAGQRASDLTRQLLAFSRRQVLQPKVVDLNALVSGFQKMLRRLIGEDLKLEVAPARSLGRVFADPGQLEQVVMNLVVNARDAMPEGGVITIETANVELQAGVAESAGVAPGRYVTLRVIDTGHGMSRETQARIFEPFFTTKEPGKGTGLGLSTVYGIVSQSDGGILCHSEPGKGTSFTLYLPRVSAPAEESAAVATGQVPGGNERILVVEDDPAVREITRELLEAGGYRVQVAADAPAALALCAREAEPPRLVVTDVVLPGMTGPQLAENLTTNYPGLRVLFISGYAAEALGRATTLPPGVDLLVKPFTREALLRRVRAALDRQP